MRAFPRLLDSSFKQFLRDRTAVFFTFAFPLLFMVIFGFVFSGSGDVEYDIGLVVEDDSALARTISQGISDIPIFNVNSGNLDEELGRLRSGDLRAVIVIPAGLQTTISENQTASLKVYYDPSQTTSSGVILSVLREVTDGINRMLTQAPVLLTLEEESIQARELRNIDYLVPGILAMSVLFLGLFGALPMVEWREKQVLKRFNATPVSRTTLISSQVVYRLALALLQAGVIIAIAYLMFGVRVLGNWLLLAGMVLLGTLTFVSIGYAAVSRAKTVEGAMPVVQLIQFPMLFLSGLFFPLEFIPGFMRPLVLAMPLTYLGDALRQVMIDATPLYPLVIEVAILVAWLVGAMLLAIKLFRWE